VSIDLIPLCSIDLTMGTQRLVGSGPAGFRAVVDTGSGVVRGDRLSGTIVGAGGDWLVVNGPVATIDVRSTIETHDGALVYVRYGGRSDFSGGPGAAPIHIAPVFETGDERYAWLNLVQAVGKGTLAGESLTYELYEVR